MNSKRIKGDIISPQEAYNYWLDSSIFVTKRTPKNAEDFGDFSTIGCCLKRRGLDFNDLEECDFSIFLGVHNGKWIIINRSMELDRIVGGEVFDSLRDLKEAWQLD